MNSAIYEGWVRHRRFAPASHQFRYRLFMMYLDLDELDEVFALSRWWSAGRRNLAQFRRSDYLAPANQDLRETVRDRIEQATGQRPAGPVRMLTHLRYFGYCFNPVTFYYAFDDGRLSCILAEITNTPWGERHCYVLRLPADRGGHASCFEFDKRFHVSPFIGMDRRYRWRFTEPDRHLLVHMDVARDSGRELDATMLLQRHPVTASALNRLLLRYPLMTAKVVAGIHWQALRLWLKRIPVHDHPDKRAAVPATDD